MQRIVLHWTAGGHTPSAEDCRHYHFIIAGDGRITEGDYRPEANENTRDGDYARHTLNCNTGSIGVAVAAMRGAQERPFKSGPSPITPAQIDALAALCAHLAGVYQIPITRRTVLTHAEVQPTLGIMQRGKWDIAWLPGMAEPGDPVAVGDRLRALIQQRLHPMPPKPIQPPADYVRQPPAPGFWSRIARALRGITTR